MCSCVLSHVRLFKTLGTVTQQDPLSMGFSRQRWLGLPLSPSGDLPSPGIKHVSPVSPALAGGFFTTKQPGKPGTEDIAVRKTSPASGFTEILFTGEVD